MMTLVLICVLLGAVLGLRFKVLVLIPGLAVMLPITAGAGIVRADALGRIVFAMVAGAICLQVGYLAGICMRHLMVVARASRIHAYSSSQSARRAAP
jgi:hypothetical protein